MKMILASNNRDKLREFREILKDTELVPQSEVMGDFEADETGETFEENAFLKADAVLRATGLPAVADDSGLEVDALGGEPGVRSARYTGTHDSTYVERCNYLLEKLGGAEQRSARFVSSICCVFPNGDVIRARGECAGTMGRELRGENGFGYDAIFIPDGYDKTMAELTPEQKNAISHRGRALRQFESELRKYNAHNK